MRLLLVEDTVGAAIGKVLERWGYEVVLADSAESAWQALNGQQIDFFLIDWNLPGMSGLDLVRKVRALPRYSTTPLVMISGRRGGQDIAQAMASGIDGYMAKPFTAVQLRSKIEEVQAQREEARLLRVRLQSLLARAGLERQSEDPFVLLTCGYASVPSTGKLDPRLIAVMESFVTALDQINLALPDLQLGYTVVESSTDAVNLLRSWSIWRRARLLVLSTSAKGNPLLLARMLSHRRDETIPTVVVCEHQDEIPLEHLARFEAEQMPILEHAELTPERWYELLREAVSQHDTT